MHSVPGLFKEVGGFRPRIGLALSGGAARGMAHIGALKAFLDNGIKIDCVAGTSIGAMVAAFFAFKSSVEEMRRQAEKMSWLKVSRLAISKSGILSNKMIGEIIRDSMGDVNIEDAAIPLAIVATDIARGGKVVLRKGNLARAVMASTAIPGIFTPVEIDGRPLVDGFLVENLPTATIREMGADIVLAVSLTTLKEYREPKGLVNILLNAFEIAIYANTILTQQNADVLVQPEISNLPPDDLSNSSALFNEGYSSAILSLTQIQSIIQNVIKRRKTSLWQKTRRLFFPSLKAGN